MADPSSNRIQCRYFIQKLSIFIDDDRSCRHIIFHFHFLDFPSILNRKSDLFCLEVSIRSYFFPESIGFPYSKPFNHMLLTFYRLPCINYISIFVQYRKSRTR